MLKIHKSTLLCTLLLGTVGASAQTQIDSEILSENPSYDITHALQDRVAGVDMKCVGTSPGEILDITIRGPKSLSSGSHPYILINGLPTTLSLSDIDPTEIDSICILKDASTAAIYGSRGKDGVILITTKSGKVNGARQLSYNSYVGMRQVFGRYPMMTGQELMDYRKDLNEKYKCFFIVNENETDGGNTNWQDRLYETGLVNNHNLSFSDGWKTGGIHAGLGFVKDNGIVSKEDYRRLIFSIQALQDIGKYVHVGASVQYSTRRKNDNVTDFQDYLFLSPLLSSDGSADLSKSYKSQESNTLDTRAFVVWNYVKGLEYRANIGYSKNNLELPFKQPEPDVTIKGNRDTETKYLAFNEQLTYSKTFTDKHHLSLLGQYSLEKSSFQRNHAVSTETINYLGGRTFYYDTEYPGFSSNKEIERFSAQFKYCYDNRYEIAYSICKDWINQEESSDDNIDESNKISQAFHSQWNLHNEPWLQQTEWINSFSLHYDLGKVCYPQAKGIYHVNTERYKSNNWGVDFRLWNGRLSGSVDFYKQNNYHLHTLLTGMFTSNYDEAETQNKGCELNIQSTIIDHWNGWTWSVGFNLSTNRNEVTKMNEDDIFYTPYYKGFPIDTPWRYVYDGIWNEGDNNPISEYVRFDPGYIRIKCDVEKDENGNITKITRQRPVSMEPKSKGGFYTNLAWRNLDLNIVGTFQIGGQVYCNWYPESMYRRSRFNSIAFDCWTPNNTDAYYPTPHDELYYQSLGWYDASMCKIRAITLGYNVPEKWLEKMHINKCRIYATAQNPWVFGSDFYKEFKMDPETNQLGYHSDYNDFNYNFPIIGVQAPSTRNYIVGVNLSF